MKTTMDECDVPDGVYFVWPDGGCWIAAKYRGGICRGTTRQQYAETHRAAGDCWADIAPSDDDYPVDDDVAVTVVHEVLGDHVDATEVSVMMMPAEEC